MFHVKFSCVFICVLLTLINAEDFAEDYFWSDGALRSDARKNCQNTIHQLICQLTCPTDICVMRGCTCVGISTKDTSYDRARNKLTFLVVDARCPRDSVINWSDEDNFCVRKHNNFERSDSMDSNSLGFVDLTKPVNVAEETYPPEMALRHHIAHFCPNLDVARKCIRTCMKVGKPAFCGKDHVCYCGHSYHPGMTKDNKADVKGTYAQFKDLYNKYFGNGYRPPESSEEHH